MSDTIPARGTKDFALYRAGVEWEHANGARIEVQRIRDISWQRTDRPKWNWSECNYRAIPVPKEPTLAERNDAVRKEWEALTPIKGLPLNEERRRDTEGREWICEFYNALNGAWRQTSPSWIEENEYRLVPAPEPPKPRYVPWTFESAPKIAKVRDKQTGELGTVMTCTDGMIFDTTMDCDVESLSFGAVFERFEQLDGSPAGTKVE